MTDAEMLALRAAAEKAIKITQLHMPPTNPVDAFHQAANPAAVLALLDRVAAARREEREACAKLARRMIGPGFGEHVEQAIRARKDVSDAG